MASARLARMRTVFTAQWARVAIFWNDHALDGNHADAVVTVHEISCRTLIAKHRNGKING